MRKLITEDFLAAYAGTKKIGCQVLDNLWVFGVSSDWEGRVTSFNELESSLAKYKLLNRGVGFPLESELGSGILLIPKVKASGWKYSLYQVPEVGYSEPTPGVMKAESG